jgi:hypothetical protein
VIKPVLPVIRNNEHGPARHCDNLEKQGCYEIDSQLSKLPLRQNPEGGYGRRGLSLPSTSMF